MKNWISYLVPVLFFLHNLQAQDNLPRFLGEKNSTTQYFGKYIEVRRLKLLEQANHLDTLCVESVCYVSFELDKDGKIKSVNCSVTAPKLISNFLKAMVKSTDSLWQPQLKDGKPVASTPFLLPVYYRILSKCKVADKHEVRTLEGFWHLHWFDPYPPYDPTARSISFQTEMMQPYIVLHPIRMFIEKNHLEK